MGSACCIAARDGTLPNRNVGENMHRNAMYSPSWNFQWENRRRVAVETENPSYRPSREMSMSMVVKREIGLDGDNSSDGGSPLASFGTPMFQKSPAYEGLDDNSVTPSDLSMEGNGNTESPRESPEIASTSAPMPSFSVRAGSSFSKQTADLLSTHTHSLYTDTTQSRRARHSPGRQLLRQVSDNLIPGMKSPNSNSVSEGRPSFVLSNCSNELTTGSIGGSSDGWSMRTFSELVASSQRERWSFNSEYLGSGRSKISESSSRFSYSPSIDLQTCGGCSKLLTERSSWRSNELQAVAVLTCGHVYHAECLETMTPDADRYDPSCPTCMVRDKQITKISRKARRAESELKSRSSKIARNRVMDSLHRSGSEVLDRHTITEAGGRAPKMEPGSSSRGSSAKPFLKRHFSLGSKWSGFLSENDSSRKKGFWARYLKD